MKSTPYKRQSVPEGIADIIRKEIRRNHQPGDALDSVHALARRFGVSVATIRNSLLILAKDGLIESIHGSGTYVKDVADESHVAILTQIDVASSRTTYYFWRVIQRMSEFLEKQGIPHRCYAGFGVPGKKPMDRLSLDFLHALRKNQISGVVSVCVT